MSELVLKAISREFVGKKYNKQLRNDEKIPGIYYAHKEKSVPLVFDQKEISRLT